MKPTEAAFWTTPAGGVVAVIGTTVICVLLVLIPVWIQRWIDTRYDRKLVAEEERRRKIQRGEILETD